MPIPSRQSYKFNCRGINLASPIDLLPPGDFPYLMNCRVLEQGSIESRPGQQFVNVSPLPDIYPNSIRRLNNTIPGASIPAVLVVGSLTNLYSGAPANGPFNLIDTGYSGDPLSMVRFRPDQSPESWLYIGDRLKMSKVNTEAIVRNIGIAPPISAPSAEVFSDNWTPVADFNGLSGWSSNGGASVPTVVQRVPASVTISHILYDNAPGTSGLATICPSSTAGDSSWLQPGCHLVLNNDTTNRINVRQVLNPISATTISGIVYDSGSTGLCTITLTENTQGLFRNSVILIGGVEAVRVLSVTPGLDRVYSIRCSTTNTWTAGAAVSGLVSFRAFTGIVVFAAGQSITGTSFNFTVTTTAVSQIKQSHIINLALCGAANLRQVQPDDYIHLSIRLDNPENLVFGRILFDVDFSTNNFTRNYYFKEFRPSDFQSTATGTLTTLQATQTAIQNNVVETAGAPYVTGDVYTRPVPYISTNQSKTKAPKSLQMSTGSQAWTELFFRVGDLQRVGTDLTRGLADVDTIAIELTCSANVTCEVSSWSIQGTYGPDVQPGSIDGIYYRYRYRDSRTGARSTPSPATRFSLFPARQAILLTPTASLDPQVDFIDVERLDPNLQAPAPALPNWTYVGSVTNTIGVIFQDLAAIEQIASNPPLDTNTFQPFPVLLPPISGTCSAIGTFVGLNAGGQFPLNLIPGAVITLNGIAFQIYAVLSTTTLELTQSAGLTGVVPFTIASPVISVFPLPVLFGPLEGPTASFVFGLGDPYNPGTLYWTNGNDADSADSSNFLEVTPPSEPLIGGVVWNTYVFVASRDRLFLITPTFGQVNQFTVTQIPAASGLWSRWAIAAGIDGVYYLGRDGIYRASPYYGGQLVSKDLWPLFPHEGKPGTTTNGITPPDMSLVDLLRISVADADVYFDYLDINGVLQTLRSAPTGSTSLWQPGTVSGWFPYNYANQVIHHYWEEVPSGDTPRLLLLTNVGLIMYAGGTDDNGTPINCVVQTPALNNGDSRAQKLYVDSMTDMVGSATLTLGMNFNETPLTSVAVSSPGSRGQVQTQIDWRLGLALYLNITASFTFAPGTKLYEFQPSFYPQPYLITSLVTQFTDHGIPGWKLSRFLKASLIAPVGQPVTLLVNTSEGQEFSYTLNSGTNLTPVYQNAQYQQKGRLFSYSLSCAVPFAIFPDETTIRIKKWGGKEFVEVPIFVAN